MGITACRAAALALIVTLTSWTAGAVAAPTITEFPVKTADRQPLGITAGPDGDIWFTELGASMIGRSTLTGEMTEFSGLAGPAETISTGSDGNLWFTEQSAAKIGRMTPTGTLEQFSLPTGSEPLDIVAGPDGNLWFTEQGGNGAIGRITTAGTITEFTTGLTAKSRPEGIAVGPEGNLWFTEAASPGRIGRITTGGTITELTTGLTAESEPRDIAAGSDGNLWFTEFADPGRIGRVTPGGTIAEFTTGLTPNAGPLAITAGNDGNVYFTEPAGGKVGKVTPSGVITEQTPSTSSSVPDDIATGPDGNIWFTEKANPGRIAVMTVAPKVSATEAVDVFEQSATLQADIGPNSQATIYEFEYGTSASYGSHTATSSIGSGASSVPVFSTLSGLSPATEYHVRAVASNPTGTTYGPDQTFTTASKPIVSGEAERTPSESVPPVAAGSTPTATTLPSIVGPALDLPTPLPAAAPAALGKSAVVQVLSGTVLVRLKGARTSQPLAGADNIPVGSLVDAEHGALVLTTAVNRQGFTQSATVWSGSFVLQQNAATGGMTTFVMRSARPGGCPARRRRSGHIAAVASSKSHKAAPTLWAKDENGHFSTRGQNSVATVRGTWWGTQERCDGTLTIVRRGLVSVRSLRRHRTVLVSAGHSYLART
jgi:virginiamycin B lyase